MTKSDDFEDSNKDMVDTREMVDYLAMCLHHKKEIGMILEILPPVPERMRISRFSRT
jgi:hypothetical protein